MAGTDGVGTKLKLAFELGKHDTIGIDLVAMSVNDIITSGAKPLFFLDYFATGKLDVDQAEAVRLPSGCECFALEVNCLPLGGGRYLGVRGGNAFDFLKELALVFCHEQAVSCAHCCAVTGREGHR